MITRWLHFHYLLPLVVIAGVAQYGLVAFNSALSGNITLWNMDAAMMDSAGPIRYVKDGFLLILGFAWPIRAINLQPTREIRRLIFLYFTWIGSVVLISLIGIFLDYSPPLFVTAGLRWILLLHAAFGVFVLTSDFPKSFQHHHLIFKILSVIVLLDLLLVLMQFASGGGHLQLGANRLTGLFNNAGIAGFFSFAMAAFVSCLRGVDVKRRLTLSAVCLFLALTSGTRSMMIFVAVILVSQLFEYSSSGKKSGIRLATTLAILPLILLAAFFGYNFMIETVDRGGILEMQVAEGGRLSNFARVMGLLYQAEIGELLIGRGLGVGTNTAYTMLALSGVSPEIYRFNWLIDNAFLTLFFQMGFLGSLIFWGGLFLFLLRIGKSPNSRYKSQHRMAVGFILFIFWAGSPFEHYFLILPFAVMLGTAYWGAKHEKQNQLLVAPLNERFTYLRQSL